MVAAVQGGSKLTRPGPDVDGWFPQQRWLNCFGAIYNEVGSNTTMEMGRQLGLNYPIPPQVRELHAAFQWLDFGYHLAHRKQGRPMFDPGLGTMTEGIGHYGYAREGERQIRSLCDSPYPCDFDLGVAIGLAQRLQPRARVAHVEDGKCRKRGADACSYVITR